MWLLRKLNCLCELVLFHAEGEGAYIAARIASPSARTVDRRKEKKSGLVKKRILKKLVRDICLIAESLVILPGRLVGLYPHYIFQAI